MPNPTQMADALAQLTNRLDTAVPATGNQREELDWESRRSLLIAVTAAIEWTVKHVPAGQRRAVLDSVLIDVDPVHIDALDRHATTDRFGYGGPLDRACKAATLTVLGLPPNPLGG